MTATRVACATWDTLLALEPLPSTSPSCRQPPPTRLLTQTGPISHCTPSGGGGWVAKPPLSLSPLSPIVVPAARRHAARPGLLSGVRLGLPEARERASKPARAAQGALEAWAQPLAPPTSPTLASLAMGAAQRHLSAWRPGKGGGSARGQAHAGRGSANHGPRPLGFWASVVIAQPLPKGRGWG